MPTVRLEELNLKKTVKDITKSPDKLSGIYLSCGGDLMFKLKLSRSFNYDAMGMYLA